MTAALSLLWLAGFLASLAHLGVRYRVRSAARCVLFAALWPVAWVAVLIWAALNPELES